MTRPKATARASPIRPPVTTRMAAVRAEAIVSLLRMGDHSLDTVTAFKEALKDRDATVRAYAAKALQ